MYCSNCGKEISDNSRFCQYCGASIQEESEQKGTLAFKRFKSSIAKAVTTKITIDGEPYGGLKENEQISFELPFGIYEVELKAALNPAEIIQMTINQDTPDAYFAFRIGAYGKPAQCAWDGSAKRTTSKVKKPLYKKWWFWVLIVFVAVGAIGGSGSDNSNNTRSTNSTSVSNSAKEPEKPIVDLSFNTDDYYVLSPSVLYEYGWYMSGERVLTQLEVSDASRTYFQSHTASEDSYRYAFKCEFDSDSVRDQLEKESTVTVAGTISDNSNEKTVTLTDCKIVSDTKYSSDTEESAQIEYCITFKTAYEEAVAAALKAERDEYAADCVPMDYSDVARNPDSHKGEKVKFSGKVIQVAEGWFDTVTYRVATKGSYEDIVYVTYTRRDGESRILEGDTITGYGECDGVESYMTVLGSSVTIPSVKMKYYN